MGRENENGYLFFEDVHGDKVSTDIFANSNGSNSAAPRTAAATAPPHIDFKNVLVYEPSSYDDVEKLIDYLKSKQPAIINLDGASPDTAQRVLDFMSGAIYALNGSVVRISGNIFLLSPEGVGISFPQELK